MNRISIIAILSILIFGCSRPQNHVGDIGYGNQTSLGGYIIANREKFYLFETRSALKYFVDTGIAKGCHNLTTLDVPTFQKLEKISLTYVKLGGRWGPLESQMVGTGLCGDDVFVVEKIAM